jgi:hypothetical protein
MENFAGIQDIKRVESLFDAFLDLDRERTQCLLYIRIRLVEKKDGIVTQFDDIPFPINWITLRKKSKTTG